MEVADRAAPQSESQPNSISEDSFFTNNKFLQAIVLNSLSSHFSPDQPEHEPTCHGSSLHGCPTVQLFNKLSLVTHEPKLTSQQHFSGTATEPV